MKALLSLIEKCTVTVEITGDKWRLTGRGFFGVLAVLAIIFAIAFGAPQLISHLSMG